MDIDAYSNPGNLPNSPPTPRFSTSSEDYPAARRIADFYVSYLLSCLPNKLRKLCCLYVPLFEAYIMMIDAEIRDSTTYQATTTTYHDLPSHYQHQF